MSIIISVLNDELDRNRRTQEAYKEELDKYSKGSIVLKKRRNVDYLYLAYRDSLNKIKTDYIGSSNHPRVNEIKEQLCKRSEIVEILKKLKIEESKIKKMIKNDQ